MSIASEISRLQSAKAAMKAAIEAKGVTVSLSAKLGDYAQLIGEIETGGAPSITLALSQVTAQDPLTFELTSEQIDVIESVGAMEVLMVDATAFEYGILPFVHDGEGHYAIASWYSWNNDLAIVSGRIAVLFYNDDDGTLILSESGDLYDSDFATLSPTITIELSQVTAQDPLVIQLTSEQAEIVESTDALMPITVDATALSLGVSTYVRTLDSDEFCLVEDINSDGADVWVAIYDDEEKKFTIEYHTDMTDEGGSGGGGYDEIAEMEFGTTYTVTFNSMGGSSVSSQTVYTGRPASEPTAPTKTSYSFGGWYADQECTEEFDFDAPIDADITLYAKWAEPGYSGNIYATPINYASYYGVYTKIKFDSAPTDDDDYDAYADISGTLNGASSFTDEHKIYVWGSSESAGGGNRALPSMVPTNCVMIGEDTWEGGISYDEATEVTLTGNGNIGLAYANAFINGGAND